MNRCTDANLSVVTPIFDSSFTALEMRCVVYAMNNKNVSGSLCAS